MYTQSKVMGKPSTFLSILYFKGDNYECILWFFNSELADRLYDATDFNKLVGSILVEGLSLWWKLIG